jgi:alpha-ketoglutaric semialdehyde dehydrogenase
LSIHQNFIAGAWATGSAASANRNPSNTDDVVGDYAAASTIEVEQAIGAAATAFPMWSRSSPELRSDILDKVGTEILARRDELGRLLSREEGKALPEGIGEVVRAGRIFKYFAGEALRINGERTRRHRGGHLART